MKRAVGKFVKQLEPVPRRGKRKRWKGSKGRQTYEEDTQHGELEKSNRRGRHIGTVNPESVKSSSRPLKGTESGSNTMTALDMIKLGIVATHDSAEELAETLVDKWHENQIPGELYDVLGLTPREYQAWATGGVSLLTIASWHKTSHPPLDHNKPWFRLLGEPGDETVGYLDQVPEAKSANGKKSRRSDKESAKRK